VVLQEVQEHQEVLVQVVFQELLVYLELMEQTLEDGSINPEVVLLL
jgi:hypothetical protein